MTINEPIPGYTTYINTTPHTICINTTPYTISSSDEYKTKIYTNHSYELSKINPFEYYLLTQVLMNKQVNFDLNLMIHNYDSTKHQTLSYSLLISDIPDENELYFTCLLNDIDNYDIIEINPKDSRYLTFGYVKCEIMGITGYSKNDSVLLKILDKKDLEK